MAKKCARTFSIVVEKGKKSILDVTHLLPDALPRSVRGNLCMHDDARLMTHGAYAVACRGVHARRAPHGQRLEPHVRPHTPVH